MPNQSKASIYIATTLLLYIPIFSFLSSNNYPVLAPESIVIFLICALFGLLLPAASYFAHNTVTALLVAALLALTIDMVYMLGSLKILSAICFIFALATSRKTSYLVAMGSVVFILTSLIQLPNFHEKDLEPATSAANTSVEDEKPFILHIVLDEHLGFFSMQQASASTRKVSESMLSMYQKEGFHNYVNAYSQYLNTYNSLPNLLNLSSSTEDRKYLQISNQNYILNESLYFEQVLQRGYKLHIYQSQYMDFCSADSVQVESCVTYGGKDMDVISRSNLTYKAKLQMIIPSFIESSNRMRWLLYLYNDMITEIPGWNMPQWKLRKQRGRFALASMEAAPLIQNKLETANNGEFVFVHLLLPHFPYIFYPDCELNQNPLAWLWFDKRPDEGVLYSNDAESRAVRYDAYASQLSCTLNVFSSFIEALKRSGKFEESIIIVHGDHGSRIFVNEPTVENLNNLSKQDFSDAYSTLFAAKLGKSSYSLVTDSMPLQNILAHVMNLDVKPIEQGVYLNGVGSNGLGSNGLSLHRETPAVDTLK